jgi:hypothetical protein
MWQEIVASITDDYRFAPPASEADIAQAEEKLGVAFPRELRAFLLEANGLHAHYGTHVISSVQRIVQDNLERRTMESFRGLYMPFDCLLFFGDNGGGDQFAYPITADGVQGSKIFMWDHETDGRPWYGPSIERYLRAVLTYEDEE